MEILINKIRTVHPTLQINKSFCKVSSKIVHVQIKEKDGNILGTGTGFGNRDATLKAYSEFIERISMKQLAKSDSTIKNSSGFASHTDQDICIENAISELIERDAILCIWLAKCSPYWLGFDEIKNLKLPQWVEEIVEVLKNSKIKLKIGIVARTGKYLTVISALIPEDNELKFGCIVDTVTGQNLNSTIESSILGISVYASILLNRIETNQIFTSIEMTDVNTVLDHMEFFLNPKNFPYWFFKSSAAIPDLQMPLIEIVACDTAVNAIDLKVYRATSVNAQAFYIGASRFEFNMDRLKENFSDIDMNNINYEIHPLI